MPVAESRLREAGNSPLAAGVRRAEPMVWLSAATVVIAIGLLVGLLGLLSVRGLGYFWPQPLLLVALSDAVPPSRLGVLLREEQTGEVGRLLLYQGSSRGGEERVWLDQSAVTDRRFPVNAVLVERVDASPLFGFIESTTPSEAQANATAAVMTRLTAALRRALEQRQQERPLRIRLASGESRELDPAQLRAVWAPNAMDFSARLAFFFHRLGAYIAEPPRQVNALGGVYPAIVGTVVLVLLMSIAVTPLGVLAAIYMQEYAQRGLLIRLVRIAVNNLAGVPSIVYGVFGLGFFVYTVGGALDSLLFSDALPAPTLGTPGLLWAALTMALLTLPVVIVATEEGLARVPQSLREGSLALGATRAETLWRVVLPAASPALLTGLILAVARATGEVAPLILVGVAKYAPVLPVSGDFPYLHLDGQFMHLGFHIFDLGFQSPLLDAEAGRVFATALLLVLIVLLLNLSAVILRGRLREAFKAQDSL